VLLRPVLLLLVIALLGGCGALARDRPPSPGTGRVDQVVDGDTVELRLTRRGETARLLGIDTPETVDPDEPVGCYGPEASARTKALLPPGTEVRLTRDVEARDRYGRLLVYVVRAADGLFVNRALVAEGYARTLPIAPNDAHRAELARAQSAARAAGRGLWGACPPDG
jgi:micrococcal nuclease